ncbi:MAG: universal stress protein [Bacteroidota bacterium]
MLHARPLLVPTDFTAGADQALSQGLQWARRLHLPLHLVHVASPALPPSYDPHRHLLDQLALHDLEGVTVRPVILRRHGVAKALIHHAVRTGAELVVMNVRGQKWVTPSVPWSHSASVFRQAPCGMLATRESNPSLLRDGRLGQMLVLLHAQHEDLSLLHRALYLARLYRADLHVLMHAPRTGRSLRSAPFARNRGVERQARMEAQVRRARTLLHAERLTTPSYLDVTSGDIADDALALAEERHIDLVVARKHESLLDTVLHAETLAAERMIRLAPCPVLVLDPVHESLGFAYSRPRHFSRPATRIEMPLRN